jgi:hypothetical protein
MRGVQLAAALAIAVTCFVSKPALPLDLSGPWAAIATDGQGRWGAVVGQLEATAGDGAIRQCPGGNCNVVQKAKGRCAAWAVSKNNPAI